MKQENVICVPISNMMEVFDLNKTVWKVTSKDINGLRFCFISRSDAEKNFDYKQLIPYAIVQDEEGLVLTYQRCGSEKRLSEMFSVGIGGHVNDLDFGQSLYDRLLAGLKREFDEEIGVRLSDTQINLIGMINEEQTEVGHCHTGVVFLVKLDRTKLKFDEEIGNPRWSAKNDLDLDRFELWSSLALMLAKI